jgi:glycosyltransferase involved in cell wall biosynthesis
MEPALRIAFAYPFWDFALPPERLSLSLEVIAVRLARDLAARGCDVTLYKRATGPVSRTFSLGGVRYRELRCRGEARLRGAIRAATRLLRPRATGERLARQPLVITPLYDLGAAADLWRRGGADVVHVFVHDGMIPLLCRVLGRSARIVLHLHDHAQRQRDPEAVRRNLGEADLIVGCSNFITQALAERFPELADRCVALPNAVDVELFRPAPHGEAESGPHFLYVGRLSPEKGVHAVIEALLRVRRRLPGAVLTLVGPDQVAPISSVDPFAEDPAFDGLRRFYAADGAYAAHLRALVPKEARASVRFLGDVPHAETRAHYARASALVFPSIWAEPFGLPVIEAMACGLPVVATNHGAFCEVVVQGETGLLVERGEVGELADAMLRLGGDPDLRAAMGRAGRARAVAAFDWRAHVARWHDTYRDLIAAGAFGPPPGTSGLGLQPAARPSG